MGRHADVGVGLKEGGEEGSWGGGSMGWDEDEYEDEMERNEELLLGARMRGCRRS